MFQRTQNKEYIKIMKSRIEAKENLVWIIQFIDIIRREMNLNTLKPISINDIGCCMGGFYKGLRSYNVRVDYQGYDIEPLYLEEARKYLPDARFNELNILTTNPRQADVSVVSATLEHVGLGALDSILSTTNNVCLLRTFLGEVRKEQECLKEGAEQPYTINQFLFEDVLDKFNEYGFETTIIKDEHTQSLPKWICPGIVRTQYVILGKRGQNS